jgi:hypothetical protein
MFLRRVKAKLVSVFKRKTKQRTVYGDVSTTWQDRRTSNESFYSVTNEASPDEPAGDDFSSQPTPRSAYSWHPPAPEPAFVEHCDQQQDLYWPEPVEYPAPVHQQRPQGVGLSEGSEILPCRLSASSSIGGLSDVEPTLRSFRLTRRQSNLRIDQHEERSSSSASIAPRRLRRQRGQERLRHSFAEAERSDAANQWEAVHLCERCPIC